MASVASETFTSTSAPIQYAAVRAFRSDLEIETYLRRCRRVLRRLGKHLTATLREAGVLVPDPKGGFYLFVDFGPHAEKLRAKGIDDSATLCETLLEETGVAILPGSAFGRPAHELSARIAYVDFDGARALAAVADVPADQPLGEDFLRTYCTNCMEGADRVAAWLGDA
jgi:aspartate aminotransferase